MDRPDHSLSVGILRVASTVWMTASILTSVTIGPLIGIPDFMVGASWLLMSFVTLPSSRRGADAANLMRWLTAIDAPICALVETTDPGGIRSDIALLGMATCIACWVGVHTVWTRRERRDAARGVLEFADLDDDGVSHERLGSRDAPSVVVESHQTVPRLERIRDICLTLPEPRRAEIDLAIDRCRRFVGMRLPDAEKLEATRSIDTLDEVIASYERAARLAGDDDLGPLADKVGDAVVSAAKAAEHERRALLASASGDLEKHARYLAYQAPGALDADD